MKVNRRHRSSQHGQAAVLFALLLIGLVAFVGLAVDGGNTMNLRRLTQNAADAAALGGVQYIATADSPTEQRLLEVINSVVEANGVPDTDGTAGNDVNGNVQGYYTDASGERLVPPNCNVIGTCGGMPPQQAFGVQVELTNTGDTFFIGVMGINTVTVGANAVGVSRGGSAPGLDDKVFVQLGDCDIEDRPFAGRANNSEFLGGIHANSWFQNSGNNNHYHFQVTYSTGFDRDNVPANEEFEPSEPYSNTMVTDPFAGIQYMDFAITGSIGSQIPAADYHDVSVLDEDNRPLTTGNENGIVEMREIINQTIYPELYNPHNRNSLVASDGVVLGPNQMRTGLYYADDLQILIGEEGSHGSGTNGQVTVVSGNIIKLTSNDMNLSAYMGQGSPIPGLLFFSDFQALADPCEFIPSEEPVINMAGSSGSVIPSVDHTTEGCPENIDGCYVQSSNVFTGLIYAPNGRVATSGAKSTFIGAIVSWTIDVNGDRSLFITNPDLIPSGVVQIFLDQ